MTEQSIERTAMAICRVMYPEAWTAGKSWEGFPDTTRTAMRQAARAAWAELSNDMLEKAARIPPEYAEELDRMGWGNRFPNELVAIFNASTNMAQRIRAIRASGNEG